MAGISASPCSAPACACGTVTIRFHDDGGKAVSGIVLPRATAEAFLAQLSAAIDRRPDLARGSLSAIRCEGNA